MSQKQHYQLDDNDEQRKGTNPVKTSEGQGTEEVAPGIPIVRSNTPRPLSFDMMLSSSGQSHRPRQEGSAPLPVFPKEAPAAPPLPEELGERDEEANSAMIAATPRTSRPKQPTEETQEFIWLFEYGLEMDSAILNSPERLDGLALLYGPAVLKGYRVLLGAQRFNGADGPTLVALAPATDANTEVWGVLYRIPRRLTERTLEEPSLLDTIHAAIPPQNFFQSIQVVVREIYRDRDLPCVTYEATDTARQQLQLVPIEHWHGDALFVQRLAAIARKQKLPDSYLNLHPPTAITEKVPGIRIAPDTDPLPAVGQKSDVQSLKPSSDPSAQPVPATPQPQTVPTTPPPAALTDRWLTAFALYLVALLLAVLTFAVLHGLGRAPLASDFALLGVPWLVTVYGLLGGCISSIITLGRLRSGNPPLFVFTTWFARPFVGAVLAGLTYLLLTSGFFVLGQSVGQHPTFFLLAGALAGLCEGRIFFWRKGRNS